MCQWREGNGTYMKYSIPMSFITGYIIVALVRVRRSLLEKVQPMLAGCYMRGELPINILIDLVKGRVSGCVPSIAVAPLTSTGSIMKAS